MKASAKSTAATSVAMGVAGVRTCEGVLIDDDLPDLLAVLVQEVLEVDLRGVVGVGPEHHAAVLPVEGEVRHLDWGAGGD